MPEPEIEISFLTPMKKARGRPEKIDTGRCPKPGWPTGGPG